MFIFPILDSMLLTLSYFQWGGFIFGVLYIVFASKQYDHSWIYGLLSAMCIVIEDYTFTQLYADGFLHILYALMAILGIILWKQGKSNDKAIRISKMQVVSYIGYFVISILIGGAAGYLLDQQTTAQYPYLDAFSTTLAIFATCLVIYRVLDVWSYWVLVNLISIFLYWQTGAPLLSLLYIGYLISNLLKWKEWRAIYQEQQA